VEEVRFSLLFSPSPPSLDLQPLTDSLPQQAAAVLDNDLVPSSQSAALPELSFHLLSSFGSPARMDYGTGHELSFLAYLLILRLIGVFSEADEGAIVKKCFAAYRQLVGRLQHSFKLEAAGKLGVWGIDEHEHLVYHSGASQSRSELVFSFLRFLLR
jgi:serine/threonine-protein phosphatase 2A activator